MTAKQWARVKSTGTHGLRRGAWYVVVAAPKAGPLVLSVRQRNVPVLREHVDFSDVRPAAWSVVRWEMSQRGAQRASQQAIGLTYGVCPACSERSALTQPDLPRLKCESCGAEYPVDWAHPC